MLIWELSYAQLKQWRQSAIDYYQQALKIKPRVYSIQQHLTRCLKQAMVVDNLSSQQQLEKYLQQGQTLKEQGDLKAALQEYVRAAELEPQRVEIYRELVESAKI